MARKKIIRIGLLSVLGAALLGTGFTLYLFNKPHWNIQGAAIDFTMSSRALVEEYLSSPEKANEKYLSDEGNSKILAIKGKVHSTARDLNGQVVLLL